MIHARRALWSSVAALAAVACGGTKIDVGVLPDASAPDSEALLEDGPGKAEPADPLPPPGFGGPLVDCAQAPCGTRCMHCAPDDPRCKEAPGFKACDLKGRCVAAPPLCLDEDGGVYTFYFPCAGLLCGEPCDPCVPGEPCTPSRRPMRCDVNGACSPQTPVCK